MERIWQGLKDRQPLVSSCHYLWTQVVAGWLLSAIFVAGVTGLMRSD